MKDRIASIIAWGIVEFIIYLVFAFIVADINFIEWDTLWRFAYAIIFIIVSIAAVKEFSK